MISKRNRITYTLIIELNEILEPLLLKVPAIQSIQYIVHLLLECFYTSSPLLPFSTGIFCGKYKLLIKILCELIYDQSTLATHTAYGTNEELGITAHTNPTNSDFIGTLFLATNPLHFPPSF